MDIYSISLLCCLVMTSVRIVISNDTIPVCGAPPNVQIYNPAIDKSGWLVVNYKDFFTGLEAIEAKYKSARDQFGKTASSNLFQTNLLNTLRMENGIDTGLFFKYSGNIDALPTGLNVGGYSLLKLNESLDVLYRMKMRNNTHFTVIRFHPHLQDMTFQVSMDLNDLNLEGEFDRSRSEGSNLLYMPTHDSLNVEMTHVIYNFNTRLRFFGKGAFTVEHIVSELDIENFTLTFKSLPPVECAKGRTDLNERHFASFLDRMKLYLDEWIQNYFNDYFHRHTSIITPRNPQMELFDQERQTFLTQFADKIINELNKRFNNIIKNGLPIPDFNLMTINGINFNMSAGRVLGLGSMYRRSVATVSEPDEVRFMVVDVGFYAKVFYKYEAIINPAMPIIDGQMELTSLDIRALLHIGLHEDNGLEEGYLSSIRFSKVENLVIGGSANRYIANFKHLLEHEIMALMINGIRHSLLSMHALLRCCPKSIYECGTDFDSLFYSVK